MDRGPTVGVTSPVVDAAAWTVHVLFGALWTGSVLFVGAGVWPRETTGEAGVGVGTLAAIVVRLTWLTRASVVATLGSGAYLTWALYGFDRLATTGRGRVIVGMAGLWLLLAGLVEAGSRRAAPGLAAGRLREPARAARPFYRAGAGVSVLLLVGGGLLAGGAV